MLRRTERRIEIILFLAVSSFAVFVMTSIGNETCNSRLIEEAKKRDHQGQRVWDSGAWDEMARALDLAIARDERDRERAER
jgi:hypothetical protein